MMARDRERGPVRSAGRGIGLLVGLGLAVGLVAVAIAATLNLVVG